MVKIKYLLGIITLGLGLTACVKNTQNVYDPQPQFRADTAAIRSFIIKNNIQAVKDASGLFYQVIDAGTGSVSYTANTKITADYEGRLLNGNVFDGTKGSPVTFQLGGVIEGWQRGIPKIQKGGKIRLIIPSLLGYGPQSPASTIPPNAILDFTITLTDVQ